MNTFKTLLFAAMASLVCFSACDSGEDPEATFAEPTIAITSPTDLTSLEVLVGSPLNFTLKLVAEAGLSSVSVNGANAKTYTGTEKEATLEYEFIPTENGTVKVIFTVEDAKGKTTSTPEISVSVVGDLGLLLVDFGGTEGASTTLSTIDATYWDGTRNIVSFGLSSGITTKATYEVVGNQFAVKVGAANPSTAAPLEYQGKAMKVVKQPADWGVAGWGHLILDFDKPIGKADVEALPQVNTELTGLTAGTKVLKMDVYYDDTQDANNTFSLLKTRTDVWNADPTIGITIDISLVKVDVHRFNHDGAGMYIGYQGYITKANEWQTITFNALDLGRVGNFLAAGDAGKVSPASGEVDGVRIIAGGGYGDGSSANAYYFRNLRIVDVK
jgi:hypothetical protein